eukprot:gene10021-13477_t
MMTDSPNIQISILAKDFGLSESLNDRVNGKIGKVLEKLGQHVINTNVVLRLHKFPTEEIHAQTTKKDSQIAEVTLAVTGGALIHASERTDDMYSSIDLVSHKIAKLLKKHNQKVNDKNKSERADLKQTIFESDSNVDFNEEDLLLELDSKYKDLANTLNIFDKSKIEVVRAKTFPMPPISMDDALLAFEGFDHPFYVFRNKETKEVNVLYRRINGGVGVIMPENV